MTVTLSLCKFLHFEDYDESVFDLFRMTGSQISGVVMELLNLSSSILAFFLCQLGVLSESHPGWVMEWHHRTLLMTITCSQMWVGSYAHRLLRVTSSHPLFPEHKTDSVTEVSP